MITSVISLIKNRKLFIGFGVAAIIGLSVWIGWSEIKSGIYDRGYNAAVQEYQEKLDEANAQAHELLIYRLQQQREELERQEDITLKRIQGDQSVDAEVKTVTEYIEKKVYVQDTCNVVPADLNSMFNNSIRSINGNK